MRCGTLTCRMRVRTCSTATASHGPYDPANGHRFNPNKLLIDPYAKSLHGRLRWSDSLFGYRVGSSAGGSRLSTAATVRARSRNAGSIEPAFTWGEDRRPQIPWEETIILELHVRGFTIKHPDVDPCNAARSPGSPRRR